MAQRKLENTTKSVVKSKSAKKPEKKPEKIDVKSLDVTQTDLAYCLGITTANITGFIQTGLMKKNSNGRMNLVECVSAYCKSLRDRKSGNAKSELDIELNTWKVANLKLKNKDWRMQRDRLLVSEILKSLSEAVGGLREKAKMNPALCDEIDHLLSCIGRIDVEAISLAVEGDETEDDE